MAIAFRAGSNNVDTTGSATSLACNKPTGVVANDLLIAYVWIGAVGSGPGTVTGPCGWTLLTSDTANESANGYFGIYYKVAGSSEPASYAWTSQGASYFGLKIVAYSGCDTTNPIHKSSGIVLQTDPWTTQTGPTVTTTIANTQIILCVAPQSSATSGQMVIGTGWTKEGNDVTVSAYTTLIVADQAQAAAGTSAATGTHETDGYQYNSIVIALAPGSAVQTASPGSIGSSQGVGNPTVIQGALTAPISIASAGGFGSPTLNQAPPKQIVSPDAIGGSGAFGNPTLTQTIPAQTVSPSPISSSEQWGALTIHTAYTATVNPIGTNEGFGQPNMQPGPITVQPAPIGSSEAVGLPYVTANLQIVGPVGSVAASEGWGQPSLTQTVPTQVIQTQPIEPPLFSAGPDYVTQPQGAVAGGSLGKARTYRYKGHEYRSLQALRKALQLEGVQDAPERPQLKRKRRKGKASTPILDAYLERHRKELAAIPDPADDVERLFNELVVLQADLKRATAKAERLAAEEQEALKRAARDAEIGKYLRVIHEARMQADDDQAFMVIMAALDPSFLPLLGQ